MNKLSPPQEFPPAPAGRFPFDNSYAQLPETFFERLNPAPVAAPRLIQLNHALARELGLDPEFLATPEGVRIVSGNSVPEGGTPIAMAYAGHQFGHFVPQLGDGRAILLGEIIGRDGMRRDIQLKGAGPTRFSRRGDGRAALGPVLREYVVSEFMAAAGIPTTRALAAVGTGEPVWRETALPGAILTRVASSHIRIGTFQFFAARRDTDSVRRLADYVIARHYPDAGQTGQPYQALLHAVVARQAELIAQWLLIGFIHGVMNTDNMSVAGETIDYGPCAFMDAFHPDRVFSSIDQGGRYAYGNQPWIAQWNLARFAECLLPLLADDTGIALAQAQEAVESFRPRFEMAYTDGLRRKLGLRTEQPGDLALAEELLDCMAQTGADFTLTFRRLCDAAESRDDPSGDQACFAAWRTKWRNRLAAETGEPKEREAAMRRVNALFIPRNHRIEEVIAAGLTGDFGPFRTLLTVLAHPFDVQPEFAGYAEPPAPDQIVRQTFCGT